MHNNGVGIIMFPAERKRQMYLCPSRSPAMMMYEMWDAVLGRFPCFCSSEHEFCKKRYETF